MSGPAECKEKQNGFNQTGNNGDSDTKRILKLSIFLVSRTAFVMMILVDAFYLVSFRRHIYSTSKIQVA